MPASAPHWVMPTRRSIGSQRIQRWLYGDLEVDFLNARDRPLRRVWRRRLRLPRRQLKQAHFISLAVRLVPLLQFAWRVTTPLPPVVSGRFGASKS
jgi:hypothetical protein